MMEDEAARPRTFRRLSPTGRATSINVLAVERGINAEEERKKMRSHRAKIIDNNDCILLSVFVDINVNNRVIICVALRSSLVACLHHHFGLFFC